jgi:hypothetical protein
MRIHRRLRLIALILVSTSALLSAQSKKADASNPDEPAIHDFLLTMPRIQKFSEVAKKMNTEGKNDAVMVAEMKKISDTDVSNVEKAALIEKSPHLAAFFKANGITAREFVLTPMTVLTAALATAAQDMKGDPPDFVNSANIQFVRDHKADLEQYKLLGGEKDGDSDSDKSDDNQ